MERHRVVARGVEGVGGVLPAGGEEREEPAQEERELVVAAELALGEGERLLLGPGERPGDDRLGHEPEGLGLELRVAAARQGRLAHDLRGGDVRLLGVVRDLVEREPREVEPGTLVALARSRLQLAPLLVLAHGAGPSDLSGAGTSSPSPGGLSHDFPSRPITTNVRFMRVWAPRQVAESDWK